MKFKDLEEQLQEYLHFDDIGAVRIVLASTLMNRMRLGNPVWMVLIGVSSGGKSQILRPLVGQDERFIHKIDDLTENTFISGMNSEKNSLLLNIGSHGVLLFSDLTTLFSKTPETRDAILAQLRLVYDGEFTKYFGNSEPKHWKGSLGVIAGSTPSIYRHFESVSDMGERFIYYRMKPSDPQKSVDKALQNKLYGKELDSVISDIYAKYQRNVQHTVQNVDLPGLDVQEKTRISRIALFAARLRTPVHTNIRTGHVDRIPFTEMPMRVALQLSMVARGLAIMQFHENGSFSLSEHDLTEIEWCAYSLANEERRACLRALCRGQIGDKYKTADIGHAIGLNTSVTNIYLQTLAAIGMITRHGDVYGEGVELNWSIDDFDTFSTIQRLEGIPNKASLSAEMKKALDKF